MTARPLSWESWAPPLDPPTAGGLPVEAAQSIAESWWAEDPHLAAALMWEGYAAMLEPEPAVRAVSTGVQSVTYAAGGGGAFGLAVARAQWHRSLAGNVGSVALSAPRDRLRAARA